MRDYIPAMVGNGLKSLPSRWSVPKTIDKLLTVLPSFKLQLFARIDHAKGAQDADMQLRPMELLIFGNARGGTPLMQENPTSGLDLPLKVLVWEDPEARVWLTYNEPEWIAFRHGLDSSREAVAILATTLRRVIESAGI